MADTQTSVPNPDSATAGGEPADIHYIDLVLGGWRRREAAFQLAIALGVDLGGHEHGVRRKTDLDVESQIVDIGATGDLMVSQAWQDACRIAAKLRPTSVTVVFAPQFDLPLRADNEWFFYFLRRLGQAIVVAGSEPKMQAIDRSPFEPRSNVALPDWRPLPDGIGTTQMRLLKLFPGLLPRRIAEAADLGRAILSLFSVGTEHFLVPTIYRDTDPRNAAFAFDALEGLEAEDEGFKAIAQTYCTSHFADVAALIELGLRHFRSGSRDLGRDLVARARSTVRDPASIARTETLLIEMNLFERRFAEVIDAPKYSPRAPAVDRERLRYLKHCAQLATGDVSAAPEFVAESLRRLRGADGIGAAEVFRLNRVVQARQASGDFDGAATLGRSVAAALAHGRVDQRLVYDNAMSLAGLHAARGDYSSAAREADRAFATTLGARSASDVLLMNYLRAKAEPDDASEKAAVAWLRAALAWLCLEPSEALGRDPIKTILGTETAARSRIDSEMSALLADALSGAWPEIAGTSPGRGPDAYPASAVAASPPRHMYAGPGAAILWTSETVTAPPPPPPRARLIRLACAALAKICPRFAMVGGGTISTEANLGTDIPGTRDEALSAALRLGVRDFCYGDEQIGLDAETRARLTMELDVQLSPIVDAVTESGDGLVVSFKRYLPDVALTGEEAQLVGALRDGKNLRFRALQIVAGGEPVEAAEAKLRKLEALHIVRLEVAQA